MPSSRPRLSDSLVPAAVLVLGTSLRALAAWSGSVPRDNGAARALVFALGTGTLLATWWLALRLVGRRAALSAALLLAVAPAAVRVLDDDGARGAALGLAAVVAIAATSRVWPLRFVTGYGVGPHRGRGSDTGRVARDCIAAGLACGAASALSLSGTALAFPLTVAAARARCPAARERGEPTPDAPPWRRLVLPALALSTMGGTLFVLILVGDWAAWPWSEPAIAAARPGILAGMQSGWPAVLLAAWGVCVSWRLSPGVALWLLAFPALHLAGLGAANATGGVLPVLPFGAIAAALGIHDVAVRLSPAHRHAAALVLSAAAAWPGLRGSWGPGW